MTVAELIHQLQALDPNLRVVMPDDATADMVDAVRPAIDTVRDREGRLNLAYADEAGARRVVRLYGPASDSIGTVAVTEED